MFEFEIQLSHQEHDGNTGKWVKPVVKGKANGCIDDYLLRTITDGNGDRWFKIGDTLVPVWNIESIKVRTVTA